MGTTSVDSRFSSLQKGVLALFIVFSFVLATLAQQASSTFQQNLESSIAKQLNSRAQEFEKDINFRKSRTFFNPFVDPNINLNQELLPKLFDLDEQYRSMYFDKEKRILRDQMLVILKQLVNVSPFETRYWLHLFYISTSLGKSSDESAWVIERSYNLMKWNTKQTALVARFCVREYLTLSSDLASSCAKIISDVVSTNNVKQLSRMLRGDYKKLSAVSKKIGLDVESNKL